MRRVLTCLATLALVSACSKAPTSSATANSASSAPPAAQPAAAGSQPTAAASPSGPAVAGVYMGGGKSAQLTEVTAHKDDPFDGKPIVAVVFSAKPQGGDANAATDALFGNFGDALVVRLEPDGTVVGADLIHHGLDKTPGSVSVSGVLSVKDFQAANGQISGHLTSGGPTDVFDQQVNVDLTFHVKAP